MFPFTTIYGNIFIFVINTFSGLKKGTVLKSLTPTPQIDVNPGYDANDDGNIDLRDLVRAKNEAQSGLPVYKNQAENIKDIVMSPYYHYVLIGQLKH